MLLAALTPKQRAFVKAYVREPNATKAAKAACYSEATAYSIGSENLRKPQIAAAVEAGLEQVMGRNEVLSRTAEVAAATMEDFLTIERIKFTERVLLPAEEARDLVTDTIAALEEELDSAKPDRADWITAELRRLHRLERKCDKAFQRDQEAEGDRPPRDVLVDVEWKDRIEVRLDLEKAKRAGKLHLVKKFKEGRYGLEIELHDAAAARELLGKHYRLWSDRLSLENPDGSAIKFVVGISEDDV